ncbi:MAG: TetR/AcrR family transcriptional regulator [Clostridia bacterium]|nr:TetR/AcrR family transcriptional regulator [Clostridia bacterium]
MAPKAKMTRDQIVEGAFALVREKGHECLNARTLASELGCSTQPIFYNFASMQELKEEVLKKAWGIYQTYISSSVLREKYPPYKASGMGYVLFAREEKELFKWLFMCDRQSAPFSAIPMPKEQLQEVYEKTGLTGDGAVEFHQSMWVFVHGIATMIATGFADWTEEQIQAALTKAYQGLYGERK